MKELNITTNSKLFALRVNVTKTDTLSVLINQAQKSDCDILTLQFGADIQESKKVLTEILPDITKPLMIMGTGDNEVDKLLLPELIKTLDRPCIIANINDKTYKEIITEIVKRNHYAVLKTPIDINLAKELNILSVDMGLDKSKIIMNTDIGGLGYGYEYGFSIMEKVRLEGEKGDEYLNLPLLSEASTESLKTKEAKSTDFSKSWGELETRARMIELSACAGIIAAGANIIIVNYPQNLKMLKGIA